MNLELMSISPCLEQFGFDGVEFTPKGLHVRASTPTSVPGCVLVRGVDDSLKAWPVVFAYTGEAPEPDGTELILGPKHVKKNVNCRLMRAGLVYPLYCRTLPYDIRMAFEDARIAACSTGLDGSLWEQDGRGRTFDSSTRPMRIRGRDDLQKLAMWPKLFRRLWAFFHDHTSPTELNRWLRGRALRDDRAL